MDERQIPADVSVEGLKSLKDALADNGCDTMAKQAVSEAGTQLHQPSYEMGRQVGWEQGVRQSEDAVEKTFQYRSPSPVQAHSLNTLREAAKHFVRVLMQNTPRCADRTAAIRKIREAVMTANFAIVSDGHNLQ